jgi:hypothetical protein
MSSVKDIFTTWTHLRNIVDDKHLPVQYEYNLDGYEVFAVDNGITYSTVIYNNAVPNPAEYSQAQNDADKADFLTNYQPTANRVMQAFAARDGYTTNVYPILQGGTDGGGIVRIFRSDTNRNQVFVGSGTAGTPSGGVLTVQGDPAGTALPISGTVTANAGTGTFNVAGTVAVSSVTGDVTVTQATAANLNAQVQGTAADGAAPVGNPVLVAGQDGTNVQSLKTDTTGRPEVVGGAADGSPPSGAPVLTAGWDGTNVQTFATDGYGGTVVTGKDAHLSPPTANPVLVAGWNGTNVVRLRLNTDGSISTSATEKATFTAAGTSVDVANNKSMISVFNADATLLTKIHEIYVVNVRTAAATGVVGVFELRRITSHSGGTLLTPVSMDTADVLDADITVRTGSTVGGESADLMWRSLFSTDDWGPGTLDVEANDHIFQTMSPIFSRKTNTGTKSLVLRQNEGLTVKFATNSTAGTFDLFLVLTQE